METKFCQSCGMPMMTAEQCGKNADGSMSGDYCCYCYENGAFTEDCTMDQMIEQCLQFLSEFNKDADRQLTMEEARAEMKEFFPKLKRWKS